MGLRGIERAAPAFDPTCHTFQRTFGERGEGFTPCCNAFRINTTQCTRILLSPDRQRRIKIVRDKCSELGDMRQLLIAALLQLNFLQTVNTDKGCNMSTSTNRLAIDLANERG